MLVITLTAIHLAIHIPAFQNFIAHKVISRIEPSLNGKIEFRKLTIAFINRVIIEDLAITGAPEDTLVSAEKIAVYVSLSDIIKGNLHASRITLKNGIFNYIEEGHKKSNLGRIFNLKPDPNDTTKGTWPHITINELRLQNFRFNYIGDKALRSPVNPGCMDYTSIGVTNIHLRATDVKTRPYEGLSAKIHYLKAHEKCGLILHKLTCDLTIDKHLLAMRNLRLKDNYSHVIADHLTFGYNRGRDVNDYVNKIIMDADFKNTFFDFKSIGFYTKYMQGNPLQLYLNGRVYGPVAHLQTSSLKVQTPSLETFIHLGISIKGLPDINKTIFDTKIYDLRSKSHEIDFIISCFSKGTQPIMEKLLPQVRYGIHLNMLGTLYDFETQGRVHSSAGDVAFDATLKFPGRKTGNTIKGKINTYDFELGRLLATKSLGKVTAGVKAEFKLIDKQEGGFSVKLDSLCVEKLGFNGYDYSNLFATGLYTKKEFDGKIIGHDPNFDFKIQGIANFSDGVNKYKLHADIPFVDLSETNIIKSDDKAQISFRTMASLTTDHDNLLGNIDLKNVTFWGEAEEHQFNSISLSALFKKGDYHIGFDSPFMKAEYTSEVSPSTFANRFTKLLIHDNFGDTFASGKEKKRGKKVSSGQEKGQTHIKIETFNSENICNILMPELYIAENTSLSLSLSPEDTMDIRIDSDRIALNKNSLKGFTLSLDNRDSIINSHITSQVTNISDIELHRSKIDFSILKGDINLNCTFDNSGISNSSLDLDSRISFSRNPLDRKLTTFITIDTSTVSIRGVKWGLSPSEITLSKRDYGIKDFKLSNNGQFVAIHGNISEQNGELPIDITMNEFDLSFLNNLLRKKINLEGIMTGSITGSNIYNSPNILMDIDGTDVALMARSVGDLKLLSKWDQTNKRMNLLIQNRIEGHSPLSVSGYYQPKGKFLNTTITFKEFSLAAIEPFLTGILKNTGGVISGDMTLSGTTEKLTLTSENTMLHNFSFTPVYTNVPYVVSGPVRFTRDAIMFQSLRIHDKFNNEGTLNGSLRHSSFNNMYLDATLAFENLQCLNTSEKDNQTFYGSGFASGNINISGPFNNLFADVNATTSPKTSIHIPLSSASSAKSEDLLTFTTYHKVEKDPYLERIKKNKKNSVATTKTSNFSLQAKANVTSDAELYIEINKQLGDILKCRGNGTVDIAVDPSRSLLDLKGDYTIDEGNYKFVLLGITAKDFIIDNGGSINFNGDIKNTSLNVGATYQTKASISTLISDTSAVGNRRTVDCGIKMSGSLSDPNISFSVDVQDLDPITKGRVESALSTDDKIQKQFMALLISGSFVPDEQSGIVNNTTILYSNAGEMLSNQFNNVFRQLDIPLDLGFNFQPASDGKTHDMFDVALSYQAFNNRVVINGNVGNNQVSQAWGGDFEAEVKLDQRGKMRLKAFTRSADDYSNYLDNTQRHGIGFTYQDEFDTFRELLRNIFWSKKRKEEYETMLMLQAEQKIMEEEKANTNKKQVQQAKENPYNFN